MSRLTVQVDEASGENGEPLTPLLGIRVNEHPPSSPKTDRFRNEHAAFRVPSSTVVKSWEHVRRRKAARQARALSLNSISKDMVRFGALLNEIISAKKSARGKDADLQLAAEIGQELLEKNQRVEEVCVELQNLLQVRDKEIRGLNKELDRVKEQSNKLTAQNIQLVEKKPVYDVEDEDDLEAFTISEFLRSELENGYVDDDGKLGEVTGDITTDLIAFRRKLRRERKEARLAKGLFDESLNTVSEERDKLAKQLRDAKAGIDATQAYKDEIAALKDEVARLEEKLRVQNIDHLAIIRRSQVQQEEAKQLEAKVIEEQKRDRAMHQAAVESLQLEVASIKKECSTLRKQKVGGGDTSEEMKAALKDNEELMTKNRELADANSENQKKIADLTKKLNSFRDVALAYRDGIQKEKEEKSKIEKRSKELEVKANDLQSKLEGLNRALQNEESKMDSAEQGGKSTLEIEEKMEAILKEKAKLEVKLMITRRKDKTRLEELKKKEEELRRLKDRTTTLAKERAFLESKFQEVEKAEQSKVENHHLTIARITEQLKILMREYSKKKKESTELQKELESLRNAVQGLDSLKSAKAKYKEMGKKMLKAMKQMDVEMKELVKKLEESQRELKKANKEKSKLQRKNNELMEEMENTEKQMNKLMRICITGTANN